MFLRAYSGLKLVKEHDFSILGGNNESKRRVPNGFNLSPTSILDRNVNDEAKFLEDAGV
ncbi:MAG: hypothetical protein ABSA11_10385 [Candidatus Bathyarchaeia archaeon]|jgi:hypothetical protein